MVKQPKGWNEKKPDSKNKIQNKQNNNNETKERANGIENKELSTDARVKMQSKDKQWILTCKLKLNSGHTRNKQQKKSVEEQN